MELDITRIVQKLPVQENKQPQKDKTKSEAADKGSGQQAEKPVFQQPATYSKEELEKYLNKMFGENLLFNKSLKFSVNSEINQVIVKVIDSSTDEVIKEIPSEEIQRLKARIREAIGVLFDEKI